MPYIIRRIAAYLIDYIIVFGAVMLIFQYLLLLNVRPVLGIDDHWFQSPANMQLYVFSTISVPVWLYFALFDSSSWRGTPGKQMLILKVMDSDRQSGIGFGRALYRTIVKLLPWEIAHIGVIWPIPLYYIEEPPFRWLTVIGMVCLVVYFFSILLHKNHQAVYDRWFRVQIVSRNKK